MDTYLPFALSYAALCVIVVEGMVMTDQFQRDEMKWARDDIGEHPVALPCFLIVTLPIIWAMIISVTLLLVIAGLIWPR